VRNLTSWYATKPIGLINDIGWESDSAIDQLRNVCLLATLWYIKMSKWRWRPSHYTHLEICFKKIVSVCEARGWLQTSDFSFGAAHWWVTLSIAIFTSPICLIVISKQDVDHETGSTFRIETLPEVGRVTATSNVHRKFGKVWTCGLWDKLADRQTERQTQA